MLLVVPISKADKHLTSNLIRSLEAFPPGPNHKLLVVGSPNIENEVIGLRNALVGYFVDVDIHIFPQDMDLGYPLGCSYYFQQTCYEVKNRVAANEGWLWYELDSQPLQANWLTTLETAYYADATKAAHEGRPVNRFMGVKERTLHGRNGDLLPVEEAGHHMCPVGIYPGDIAEKAPILNSLTGSAMRTFSEHIQWYVMRSFHETSLIQNNRSTINYTTCSCESVARNPWGVHWNNLIRDGAVLLHGVKDSSLLDLLAPAKEVPIPEVESVTIEPEITPEPSPVAPLLQPVAPLKKKRPRSKMSKAAREAMSQRMQDRWAARRAAKGIQPITVEPLAVS